MRAFEVDWWPKKIVSGENALERLPAELDAEGKRRVVILCGRTVSGSDVGRRVREALGAKFVGAFEGVQMHAPLPVIKAAAEYAKSLDADAIVSVGGGSAIDTGKGVCLADQVGDDFLKYELTSRAGAVRDIGDIPAVRLHHIAIPTTAGSGSEITPTCGFRDPAVGHKRIFRSEQLIPKLAILDPTAAAEAPPRLTALSGMTAVARAVESLYSGRRNPFRTALALQSLRLLNQSLPKTIATPNDLDARGDCLVASAMSAISANINTSAVHAIGHIVGGMFELQHGVVHAILLGAGMRVMLPTIGEEQKLVLLALGESASGMTADTAGARAAALVDDLVAKLPVLQNLSALGMNENDLARVAERAAQDPILLSSGVTLSAETIKSILASRF